jgi:hypothetical protein
MSKDGIASLTLFFKIDRSTQKLTTGRIHNSMLDVRPARNALMAVLVEFSHLIYISMSTPIKSLCMAGGCSLVSFSIWLAAPQPSAALNPEPLNL